MMRPINSPLVPSAPLLRFLRSQSRGLSGTGPRYCPATSARRYHRHHQHQSALRPRQCPAQTHMSTCISRPISTTRSRNDGAGAQTIAFEPAALQASVFNLKSIFARRSRHTQAIANGQHGRTRGNDTDDGCSQSDGHMQQRNFFGRLFGPWSPAPRQVYANPEMGNGLGQGEENGGYGDNGNGGNDDGDDGVFAPRRSVSAKAALEPRLRCTEVDENGNFTAVDGEFKKTELIAKYGLLPRDLRKIDSSNLPHILVRPSAILLNLLHLKVLIKHDRVLLFDLYGSQTSYSQHSFMNELQAKLKQKTTSTSAGGLPYEFRALEVVLTSVTAALEADFETVREPIMQVLGQLEDDIDRHRLRELLILSKRVSTFEQRAKLVRDAIDELLEAEDDLAAMYLTEKASNIVRGEEDHTEVEMLLESYHKLCDEIVQEAGNLVSGIRNTEEIIRAILDANRNALMLLDLKFSVGTLGLATGTFIAGLYGMNLKNFLEESALGFGGVTAFSVVLSIIVCGYGLVKLRKVQRVKMSVGDAASAGRGGLMSRDDVSIKLVEEKNRERIKRQRTMSLNKAKWAKGRKNAERWAL